MAQTAPATQSTQMDLAARLGPPLGAEAQPLADARDTDELIKQRVPVYSKKISRGIRPGRLEMESVNQPVTVGGVYIRPGDLIVADGDGAICVPIERAQDVATWAWKVANGDKQGRRRLYEAAGLTLDDTVEVREGA